MINVLLVWFGSVAWFLLDFKKQSPICIFMINLLFSVIELNCVIFSLRKEIVAKAPMVIVSTV